MPRVEALSWVLTIPCAIGKEFVRRKTEKLLGRSINFEGSKTGRGDVDSLTAVQGPDQGGEMFDLAGKASFRGLLLGVLWSFRGGGEGAKKPGDARSLLGRQDVSERRHDRPVKNARVLGWRR